MAKAGSGSEAKRENGAGIGPANPLEAMSSLSASQLSLASPLLPAYPSPPPLSLAPLPPCLGSSASRSRADNEASAVSREAPGDESSSSKMSFIVCISASVPVSSAGPKAERAEGRSICAAACLSVAAGMCLPREFLCKRGNVLTREECRIYARTVMNSQTTCTRVCFVYMAIKNKIAKRCEASVKFLLG